MNGKQSKLLRKMGRADKASKREFQKLTANQKGVMREQVTAYLAFQSLLEAAEAQNDASETSELVKATDVVGAE